MRIPNVLRSWLFKTHSRNMCRVLGIRQVPRETLHVDVESKADPKVLALRDKLLYCDYLDGEQTRMGYARRRKIRKEKFDAERRTEYEKIAFEPVYSVTIENEAKGKSESKCLVEEDAAKDVRRKPVQMPYKLTDSYEWIDSMEDHSEEADKYKSLYKKYLGAKNVVASGEKQPSFKDFVEKGDAWKNMPKGELWKVPRTWMFDYEEFNDALIDVNWYKNYGTANPNSEVSCIPCGGCGALLHCRDPAIPGYLPSELFLHRDDATLKSMVCQRCHFLTHYNAALEVKVSIEDYPKLLKIIKRKKCAIILIVDLTDFPCSIWPDLASILHPFTPIYLVGNKVDLLPRDSPSCLENIKRLLLDTVVDVTGVKRENFTHVELTSATTGFGIERLINKLQYKWRYKGDVYLIGCTNVGKSSMFNALLNSDYCKVQAVDLVQRATVSAWPGTTLNLLKFPLLNPTDKKRWLRTERLKQESFYRTELAKYRDYQFRTTRKMEFATLKDHVGRTFGKNSLEDQRSMDPFSERSHNFMSRKEVFDESRPEYEHSRWCYDTPGTVQDDQILDLLTTDELLLTLPREIISPRTFTFKPGQSVFVAGMGRLDYVEGEYFIRCTVFASQRLPITICRTIDADEVYERLLETEAFVVPENDPERLKVWPKLESKDMEVIGAKDESAADVVLSSIGWIAITPHENESVSLKAWTPQGRGVHLRCPALLSKSVHLRGPRVTGTPMFMLGRQVYVKV